MTIFVDNCYQNSHKHRLYVLSLFGISPCGFRLWKENKFPIDKFVFDSKLEANKACVLLQEYVSNPDNESKIVRGRKQKYVEERKTIFG